MLPKELTKVVDAILAAGGRPYLVGGAVRDYLVEGEVKNKDFDIEVFKLDLDSLVATLQPLGRVSLVGKSFGVILLKCEGYALDISLPRKESKQGRGHRGFIVNSDPNLDPKIAASRRDFTINALMYDFKEDRILDFFDGQAHLKEGVLSHINEHFADDPLRVLRGFQFASRFDLTTAPDTAQLCKKLLSEYDTLPKERIWNEWFKWATVSKKPSRGLKFLRDTGWIEHYPEIGALQGCEQNPEWHPEGDVFIHTCYVVDAAAEIADRENLWGDILEAKKPESKRLGLDRAQLLFAALCHDFGKPATTVWAPDGRGTPGTECWRSPAHDKVGVKPTLSFLENIGSPTLLKKRVPILVKEHLAHAGAISGRAIKRLVRRLDDVTLKELSYVIEADASGRPPKPKGLPVHVQEMMQKAETLNIVEEKVRPLVTGKLLLQHKLAVPGPAMGQLLAKAMDAQTAEEFATAEEGIEWIKLNLF